MNSVIFMSLIENESSMVGLEKFLYFGEATSKNLVCIQVRRIALLKLLSVVFSGGFSDNIENIFLSN